MEQLQLLNCRHKMVCSTDMPFRTMDSTLYFTADDLTRPQYEHRGMQCFVYSTQQHRVQVRSYYEVPTG